MVVPSYDCSEVSIFKHLVSKISSKVVFPSSRVNYWSWSRSRSFGNFQSRSNHRKITASDGSGRGRHLRAREKPTHLERKRKRDFDAEFARIQTTLWTCKSVFRFEVRFVTFVFLKSFEGLKSWVRRFHAQFCSKEKRTASQIAKSRWNVLKRAAQEDAAAKVMYSAVLLDFFFTGRWRKILISRLSLLLGQQVTI